MENLKFITKGFIIEKVLTQSNWVREEDSVLITSDYISEFYSETSSAEDRVMHVCTPLDPAVDMGKKVLTIGGSERQFIWGENLKKFGIKVPNKRWGVFLDKKSPDKFFLTEDTNANFDKAFVIFFSEKEAVNKIAELRGVYKDFLSEINSIPDSDWKDELYGQIWFKMFKFNYD